MGVSSLSNSSVAYHHQCLSPSKLQSTAVSLPLAANVIVENAKRSLVVIILVNGPLLVIIVSG
jgi:hypothetical protein